MIIASVIYDSAMILYLATVWISLIFSLDYLLIIIYSLLGDSQESSESKFISDGILEATLRSLDGSLPALDILLPRDEGLFNDPGSRLSCRRDLIEVIAFRSTLLVALCYTVCETVWSKRPSKSGLLLAIRCLPGERIGLTFGGIGWITFSYPSRFVLLI